MIQGTKRWFNYLNQNSERAEIRGFLFVHFFFAFFPFQLRGFIMSKRIASRDNSTEKLQR